MIAVTGATGTIGEHLVAELSARGTPFRIVARDPRAAARLGGEIVHGDFDAPETLVAAFAGADQLFLNAGGAVPVDGPQPMIRQQLAAIDAAAAAGIGHVVKVSVLRAAPGRPLAEGAHGEIEHHLHGAGPTATILRPSGFMQNFVTGVSAFTPDGGLLDIYGGARVAYIDAVDIAACAAVVLDGGRGSGGTHELTGPEALTQADIAALISTAVSRAVSVADLPPARLAELLLAQGVAPGFADEIARLCADVATGSLATTTGTVATLTGRSPRTFADFAAANARGLLRAITAGAPAT